MQSKHYELLSDANPGQCEIYDQKMILALVHEEGFDAAREIALVITKQRARELGKEELWGDLWGDKERKV